MKKDHYQSAAIITAALISEHSKRNGPAPSKEEAASLYAELVVALDDAVKKLRKADDQPD